MITWAEEDLFILWFLLTGIAKKYKKNGINKAPTGWQNAIEPVIGFIDENVAKPNPNFEF